MKKLKFFRKFTQTITIKQNRNIAPVPGQILFISCVKYYGLPIIQQELYDMNSYKIPKVAKLHNVECLRLIEFFAGEGWSFQ